MKKLFLLVFSIFFVACFNTTTTTQILDSNDQIEFYNTSDKYPFSEATVVNNVIYLSGKIGTDPSTGELVEGGIAAETKQIMDNIKNTLTKMGSSMDNIFKCKCNEGDKYYPTIITCKVFDCGFYLMVYAIHLVGFPCLD